VNKQVFIASSRRSNQAYTKMHDQPTIKMIIIVFTAFMLFAFVIRPRTISIDDKSIYYKDSHGCVVMFDLTNGNSFINTQRRDVDSKYALPDGRPIPCLILASKVGINEAV
jgi:hypothetical protein